MAKARTVYTFGWVPDYPDFRDLLYAFQPRREIMKALPPSVDLSQPSPGAPYDPPWSQGDIGSCGPNAISADILHALMTVQKVSDAPVPSRLYIYFNTRYAMGTLNQDSGVQNRIMLKTLAASGWCDESLWGYDTSKYKVKPPQECYVQGAARKIIEYNAVAQNLETMQACLAGGDTFLFGFTVYSSMQTATVEESGDIPMPSGRDRAVGGHDVLICGYSNETQRFKLRNSWGDWGNSGMGTIPYAYALNPHLARDFWTIRKSPWPTQPPPEPGPTPPPASGLAPLLEARDNAGKLLGKYNLAPGA